MENANVSPALTTEGLAFAYPNGHTLFTDINLVVKPATLLCITGRSGAGKSTLLYCLAGVLKAVGDITLLSEPLPMSASQRATLRLTKCGFVFQRGELLPELSIVENVELPLRMVGHSRNSARQTAVLALTQLGIAECADRNPSEISGGQAQRASVARALIHSPRIVFADEPTASLDSVNRDEVIRHLQDTIKHGTTVICATHDPALISLADDILDLTQR
jgi:putative ABC transport system ATP-binding protein